MLKAVFRIRNNKRLVSSANQIRFFSRESHDDDDDRKDKSKGKIKLKKDKGESSLKGSSTSDEENDHEEKMNKLREENAKANVKAIHATKVGAMANVGLATSKCILGLSVGSTALVADGVSSFGDLLCDGVVYYTVTEARKKSTPDRPWGSGKIEPLGINSLLFSILIFCE